MVVDCVIFKGHRQPDSYLYVLVDGPEADPDLDQVPERLRALLGRLEEVMRLTLDEGRRLAQADVRQVMADLRDQGYFLQLPPDPVKTIAPRLSS